MKTTNTRRHRTLPLCAALLFLSVPATAPAGPPDGDLDLSPVGSLFEKPAGPSVPTPSREGLRLLVQLDPAALGPLSIGSPNAGLLFNPRAMPEGPLWKIRNPRETYGTAETIDYVIQAIETVERQFPGSPPIVIGDISDPDGGRLNWHASHQVGRDVDIGFYHRREVDDLLRGRKSNLDVPRTWALVRALITETDVDRIFVDRYIQRYLFSHAVEIGEDRDWLDDIFGRKTAGRNAIIQHVRRHRDHLHVRFHNPRAQEWGRIAYPLLVKAKLAPGPTVSHRVRRGETLSHLSRRYGTSTREIRRANGLRSSLIRAGRRYVIPIRKIPSEAEPIVIPPRRLPPARRPSIEALPPALDVLGIAGGSVAGRP
jgi:penicillin-insensitive murein endopeptidase